MRRRLVAVVALSTLALLGAADPAFAATGPDTVPPTKPATPTANPIGLVTATINTGGSTDNDRVAGYYVQRQVNGVWTDWSSTLIEPTYAYVQPLTPGTTYTAVVVAFDPSGNRSVRSDPVTFTTPALAAPTCRVVRQIISPQIYILNFFVENMTAAIVVTNWTTTFTMPAAQTLVGSFSSTLSRSGDVATLRPMSNTAVISPGMTAFFGLYANRPVGSPLPSGFTFTSAATGTISCTTTDRTG
ncbi:MAG TPA: cellulose binding domain-containing protein [Micromonosporaceae bacterium]|nr:cellulose binding domain-containing protein [Micromonosporaceae bacterium]